LNRHSESYSQNMALPDNYFQTLIESYNIKYDEKFSGIHINIPEDMPREDVKVLDIILGHIYLNTFDRVQVTIKVGHTDYYFYRYYLEEKCKFYNKKCTINVKL